MAMKILTNTLILIALLLLVAICASAQVTYVSIHAPCTQTANLVVGAYSGSLAIVPWQLGVMVVNTTTGAQTFRNGVWMAMLGGCSGRSDLVWDSGDCWQSVVTLTASNGTPKWLLTPGAPDCWSAAHPQPVGMNGLFYWKWDGSKYVEQSLISPPTNLRVDRLSTAVLAGDTAWVKLTQNVGWVPCDLNAGICNWLVAQPAPPSGEGRQSGIGGFTYNVGVDYAFPPENGGPTHFWMARSDQPTPTRPPAPTNTMTPTGGVPRTPTITPTYNPCPPFCPPTATRTPTGTARSATPTATVRATPTVTPAPMRFSVAVTWTKPDGTSGTGSPLCQSQSSGSSSDFSSGFYFFDSANTELFVSVLPSACSINGHVWTKIYGGTNVAVSVVIIDNLTGFSKTYTNPQGQLFQTVIDTGYEVCP